MKIVSAIKRTASSCIATILAVSLLIPVAYGQDQQAPPPPDQQGAPPQGQYDNTPPPTFPPQQLDGMVSRIALYPDPLLAQILTASTFGNDIPDAARWSDEHHYLQGQQLSDAINQDQLPWDPSVLALLPFPSVLDMMASDMNWTNDLGNAVLAQRPDVMDAVQRERHRAYQYGYLRSNQQIVVTNGPYIDIEPYNPAFVVVPDLQSRRRLRASASWLLRRRRHRLRFRRHHRRILPPVGLGQQPLRVGQPRRDRQQSPVGPHLGQPPRLRSPV